MAHTKNLEDAIDELMKDYKRAATKAAEYATERIKEDMYDRALQCLEKYYYNYTERTHKPNSYHRTDRLKDSFVPFSSVSSKGNNIACSMGVLYDYDRLDGYYYGSKKYSPTDSWWIVDNYLDGIHPTTNGASVPGEVKYIPVKVGLSPSDLMDTYIDRCEKRFDNYMLISFLDQISRM